MVCFQMAHSEMPQRIHTYNHNVMSTVSIYSRRPNGLFEKQKKVKHSDNSERRWQIRRNYTFSGGGIVAGRQIHRKQIYDNDFQSPWTVSVEGRLSRRNLLNVV